MRNIKIDCPHCNMDDGLPLIPGRYQRYCLNCKKNFVVIIDDYCRVHIQKADTLIEVPCHDEFIKQMLKILPGESWEILQNNPKNIDFIARKNLGFGNPIAFLGISRGTHRHFNEIKHILNTFQDFIEQNSDVSDILHSFIGLLLMTFDNVFKTEIDDKIRELESNSFWKRIYTSAAAYDFFTERYFAPKSKYGQQLNIILQPLFHQVDLIQCKK